MAELKTKQNNASVTTFLDGITDAQKRQDAYAILELMEKVTGMEARMWGDSIVGFGNVQYKYASGHEGDTCLVGFSPRKQNLTLYTMTGFGGSEKLLKRLGKHKTGKGCLYINRLTDIDLGVLEELIRSWAESGSKS
jgi:hypothetical protein